MLQRLSIQNFILVESASLDLAAGLSVLTGETGAGKSILLGALGLLLGDRSSGQPLFDAQHPATLTAEYDLSPSLQMLLEESGVSVEDDTLIIRRQLLPDGKSRAFINDAPASLSLLKTLAPHLVEIHGQQGQSALTDSRAQRQMLDSFAGHKGLQKAASTAYENWQSCVTRKADRLAALEQARQQEDYLRHIQNELGKLNPQPGEEEELAVARRRMMQAESLGRLLQDAKAELEGANPVENSLARAARLLARSGSDGEDANPTLDALLQSLDDAQQSVAEALQSLESLMLDSGFDANELDRLESRLFELRGAARKHSRPVEALPEYLTEIQTLLASLDSDESALAQLEKEEKETRLAYETAAQALTTSRQAAALKLAQKVVAELAPLKMAATQLRIDVTPQTSTDRWAMHGWDAISFEVSTNPGAPFDSLAKIASGGELSRFMLALKVVLAADKGDTTLIFDEIDTGTSGAVAEAIGERLAQLGKSSQVLCITHLPQVASKGSQHFKVAKQASDGKTRTRVTELTPAARQEELAQMLSGQIITDEARQVAQRMLAS